MQNTEQQEKGSVLSRTGARVLTTTLVGAPIVLAGTAFAATPATDPTPVPPSTGIASLTSNLESGIVQTVTDNIVPIASVMIFFTVAGVVIRWMGVRRK